MKKSILLLIAGIIVLNLSIILQQMNHLSDLSNGVLKGMAIGLFFLFILERKKSKSAV